MFGRARSALSRVLSELSNRVAGPRPRAALEDDDDEDVPLPSPILSDVAKKMILRGVETKRPKEVEPDAPLPGSLAARVRAVRSL